MCFNLKVILSVTLGTDHLTCKGGYGFLFRSEKYFLTTRELEFLYFLSKFFPEFNIRLYDKKMFFLRQNQNIFSTTLGIRIFFFEKNHNPPLQVKWSVP